MSRPSLRSLSRGGWFRARCGGIGASGRFGRLLDRSGKLGVAFLDKSERPGIVEDAAAAFASFSRRCCSLLSRTSDFRGSLAAGEAVMEDLDSAAVSTEAGFVVGAFAVVLASSTSPSSISAAVGAFGVETPRELKILLVGGYRYSKSLTYLALEPGLNSGAVGFKLLFEGVPLAWVAFPAVPFGCAGAGWSKVSQCVW